MAEEIRKDRRSRLGFGSSYRKGGKEDLGREGEIDAVLGGQVWMVKPDKDAQMANPCIWMQAGVVDFKTCNNYYECTSCKYDLGMQKQVQKGKRISWQDVVRRRPAMDRVCRHTLTQRIGQRVCAYDYNCSNCDFGQDLSLYNRNDLGSFDFDDVLVQGGYDCFKMDHKERYGRGHVAYKIW